MPGKIGHTALVWTFNDPLVFRHAVRSCGRLGFAGTEVNGRVYDALANDPEGLRHLLDESGVTLAALFETGDWTEPEAVPELIETARRWADAVARFGGDVLVLVPGTRRREHYTLDDAQVMADAMNTCGQIAQNAGIIVAMHPHWGTTVETEAEIDGLLGLLDPALVGFAPDTGQIAKGGADPVAVMHRHAARIRHVHLKDLATEWPQLQAQGVPLDSPQGYAEPCSCVLGGGRARCWRRSWRLLV